MLLDRRAGEPGRWPRVALRFRERRSGQIGGGVHYRGDSRSWVAQRRGPAAVVHGRAMQFDRIETSVCSTPGRWSIGVSGGPVGHAGSSWARPGSS